MNIGFDAKRLFLNHSGLGNYSRNLVWLLGKHAPGNHYLLYTPTYVNTEFGQFSRPPFERVLPQGAFNKAFAGRWRSHGIIKQILADNLAVYHGLSNELPYNIGLFKGKKIVTIHDLIFMRFPSYYSAFDRNNYRKKVIAACMNADVVISISTQTKNDLVEFFKVDEKKIEVHGQSCSEIFWSHKELAEKAIFDKQHLPSDYILYVGTVEPRKNLLNLIKAVEHVDLPLVVVGRLKSAYGKKIMEYIASKKMGSKIVFAQNVTDSQLAALYNKATCLVYPSSFEGFGLPVLEAMVCACPVITGNNSSLTEVGGNAAVYIDVNNVQEYTNAVNNVINSSDLRKSMILKGLEQSKAFTPEVWVNKTVKSYV
ncbi:MAG TPA: glycosyltransferase family 1 protein [Flavobacteriales bacterium]|nr:glycosyltransferase family 1 protein [Flavobacteriales bacterium]